MGYFTALEGSNFPKDVQSIIQRFKLGEIGIIEALGRCGEKYFSNARTEYTHDIYGKPVRHTVITFGSPVRFEFRFR